MKKQSESKVIKNLKSSLEYQEGKIKELRDDIGYLEERGPFGCMTVNLFGGSKSSRDEPQEKKVPSLVSQIKKLRDDLEVANHHIKYIQGETTILYGFKLDTKNALEKLEDALSSLVATIAIVVFIAVVGTILYWVFA